MQISKNEAQEKQREGEREGQAPDEHGYVTQCVLKHKAKIGVREEQSKKHNFVIERWLYDVKGMIRRKLLHQCKHQC